MRHGLKEYGKRIQQLRKERELTQEQLAEKLNVSQNTIAKIESGLRRSSIDFLLEISEFFNVSTNYKAQLAYSFDMALQNEFSLDENIELAREFVQKYFVFDGMICDLAVHQLDKEEGGIPNPHFHVLVPICPLNDDGTWGAKQHRVYHLDEDGNRIKKENGQWEFDAVPTTNWGRPETLDMWREAWADMINAKFEEKGMDCRIDHRSYVDQ